MKLILLKSWRNKFGKVYPVGQILQCDKELSRELITGKVAEQYSGKYPPEGKVKTNFFKPKN